MDRARAILPAYLPFLYATRRPGFDTTWLAAATATVALDRQMKRPREGTGEASSALTREQMEQLNSDLTAATREVNLPLEQLERPFLRDAVRRADPPVRGPPARPSGRRGDRGDPGHPVPDRRRPGGTLACGNRARPAARGPRSSHRDAKLPRGRRYPAGSSSLAARWLAAPRDWPPC